MAYFESSKLKDSTGSIINPAQDESLSLLRSILKILKPLSMITGGGSNRLNVDINTVPSLGGNTLGTVGTVSTLNGVNGNISGNLYGVTGFDLMKAMSRTAYNTGIRSNIT